MKYISKEELAYFKKVKCPAGKIIIKPQPVQKGLIITDNKKENSYERAGVVLQSGDPEIKVGSYVKFSEHCFTEIFVMDELFPKQIYQSLLSAQILFVDDNVSLKDFVESVIEKV